MADAILTSSGIYLIRNTLNQKVYVGSAVNCSKRFKRHKYELSKNEHHSLKLQRAWNKYGAECFEFTILEQVQERDFLFQLETKWIAYFNSYQSGYNATAMAGTFRLTKMPRDAVLKAAEKRRGLKRTPEQLARLSAAKKGQLNSPQAMQKCWDSNKGRKHTKEFGEAIRLRKKGQFVSQETRLKQSIVRTGKVHSESSNIKKSIALKGRPRDQEVYARILATKAANKLKKQPQNTAA